MKKRRQLDVPASFSSHIILRMFNGDEKKLKEFTEEYRNNRHKQVVKPADDLDRKIFKDFVKNKMLFSELQEKYHCSIARIQGSIARCAREQG